MPHFDVGRMRATTWRRTGFPRASLAAPTFAKILMPTRYASNQAMQHLLAADVMGKRNGHCKRTERFAPLPEARERAPAPAPGPSPGAGPTGTCQASNATLDLFPGSVRYLTDGQGFGIQAGDCAAPDTVGMFFNGQADIAPLGCGDIEFTQNVGSIREFRHMDGSVARLTVPEWHLDDSEVYLSHPVPGQPSGHAWRATTDCPGLQIGGFPEGDIDRMLIEDSYRMFLRFRTNAQFGGAVRTLRVGIWKFRGEAGNRGGRLVLLSDASHVRVVGTEQTPSAPIRSPRAQDVPWQVVAGRRGSSAQRHLPILNRHRSTFQQTAIRSLPLRQSPRRTDLLAAT